MTISETIVLEKSQVKKRLNSETQTSGKANLPTYEQIRIAIPKECFEKSLPTSLFYLVFDYTILAGLYLALPYIELYAGWLGLLAW